MPNTDRTGLGRLAEGALGWVAAHLDEFEHTPAKRRPEKFRQDALTELALTCLWLRDTPVFGDRRVGRILQFVSRLHAASPTAARFRERVHRSGSLSFHHLGVTVALARCGRPVDDRDRAAIRYILEWGNVAPADRTPHGQVELRYLLDKGGFAHDLPSYAAIARDSIVAGPLNPIYVTDRDAYSITHLVFFLTDFGAVALPGLTPRAAADLGVVAEQLIGVYLRRGDWDLVGEFLLACACLRRPASPLYRFALRALAEAQSPDGGVPGRGAGAVPAPGPGPEQSREARFDHCYHPTLVALLVGALCPDGE